MINSAQSGAQSSRYVGLAYFGLEYKQSQFASSLRNRVPGREATEFRKGESLLYRRAQLPTTSVRSGEGAARGSAGRAHQNRYIPALEFSSKACH
ncbi:hypothetical protein EVAR_49256_1 [Eumeta japonica]|uniref:Uncharacterized protein n=1 Tax=Eumeta variegata TaxID=151549 RepID=A0A4C1YL75_EUMVA|nr:hypothetical protein EVAR_49256_1 [Eumeta japonica]